MRSDSTEENIPSIKILTGTCNHLTPSLPDLIDSGKANTLNRTRFLLVEPPFGRLPIFLEDVLGRLLTQRLVPVLAHPERNIEFQRKPKRLEQLVEEGAVVQIASGSLTGQYGDEARKTAEQFILQGMAHVVASEMHANTPPRSPILSDSFSVVTKLIGEKSSIDLFETNPRMLLEGRLP
jgi:protein-tyrosine phosphatase